MSTEQTPTQQPPVQQAAPPPYAPAPQRRLTRTPDDKMLAGVCGGLARYLNVDATLVRVVAVVLGVVTFPVSVLAYVVLWLVMPAA